LPASAQVKRDTLLGVSRARLRFYAELNDFLPSEHRFREFERSFGTGTTVKDLIESTGVPHTEVDLVVVNGRSLDFSRLVRDGDRISVYPTFESFDISPALKVRAEPLRRTRFVLDVHLGKLARHLRLLGFDALYERDRSDPELAEISAREQRILLTRDVGLLKRRIVTHGYFVRERDPKAQLAEVVARLDLARSIRPFTRCLNCNGELIPIDKQEIVDRLEARTRRHFDEFWICRRCENVYWKGSHYDRLLKLVASVHP
jgi:uncharacterized protein with PIN domain/sulfur carrier protein ThiS